MNDDWSPCDDSRVLLLANPPGLPQTFSLSPGRDNRPQPEPRRHIMSSTKRMEDDDGEVYIAGAENAHINDERGHHLSPSSSSLPTSTLLPDKNGGNASTTRRFKNNFLFSPSYFASNPGVLRWEANPTTQQKVSSTSRDTEELSKTTSRGCSEEQLSDACTRSPMDINYDFSVPVFKPLDNSRLTKKNGTESNKYTEAPPSSLKVTHHFLPVGVEAASSLSMEDAACASSPIRMDMQCPSLITPSTRTSGHTSGPGGTRKSSVVVGKSGRTLSSSRVTSTSLITPSMRTNIRTGRNEGDEDTLWPRLSAGDMWHDKPGQGSTLDPQERTLYFPGHMSHERRLTLSKHQCPMGHLMEGPMFSHSSFYCHECNVINLNSMMWTCTFCVYDVCGYCNQKAKILLKNEEDRSLHDAGLTKSDDLTSTQQQEQKPFPGIHFTNTPIITQREVIKDDENTQLEDNHTRYGYPLFKNDDDDDDDQNIMITHKNRPQSSGVLSPVPSSVFDNQGSCRRGHPKSDDLVGGTPSSLGILPTQREDDENTQRYEDNKSRNSSLKEPESTTVVDNSVAAPNSVMMMTHKPTTEVPVAARGHNLSSPASISSLVIEHQHGGRNRHNQHGSSLVPPIFNHGKTTEKEKKKGANKICGCTRKSEKEEGEKKKIEEGSFTSGGVHRRVSRSASRATMKKEENLPRTRANRSASRATMEEETTRKEDDGEEEEGSSACSPSLISTNRARKRVDISADKRATDVRVGETGRRDDTDKGRRERDTISINHIYQDNYVTAYNLRRADDKVYRKEVKNTTNSNQQYVLYSHPYMHRASHYAIALDNNSQRKSCSTGTRTSHAHHHAKKALQEKMVTKKKKNTQNIFNHGNGGISNSCYIAGILSAWVDQKSASRSSSSSSSSSASLLYESSSSVVHRLAAHKFIEEVHNNKEGREKSVRPHGNSVHSPKKKDKNKSGNLNGAKKNVGVGWFYPAHRETNPMDHPSSSSSGGSPCKTKKSEFPRNHDEKDEKKQDPPQASSSSYMSSFLKKSNSSGDDIRSSSGNYIRGSRSTSSTTSPPPEHSDHRGGWDRVIVKHMRSSKSKPVQSNSPRDSEKDVCSVIVPQQRWPFGEHHSVNTNSSSSKGKGKGTSTRRSEPNNLESIARLTAVKHARYTAPPFLDAAPVRKGGPQDIDSFKRSQKQQQLGKRRDTSSPAALVPRGGNNGEKANDRTYNNTTDSFTNKGRKKGAEGVPQARADRRSTRSPNPQSSSKSDVNIIIHNNRHSAAAKGAASHAFSTVGIRLEGGPHKGRRLKRDTSLVGEQTGVLLVPCDEGGAGTLSRSSESEKVVKSQDIAGDFTDGRDTSSQASTQRAFIPTSGGEALDGPGGGGHPAMVSRTPVGGIPARAAGGSVEMRRHGEDLLLLKPHGQQQLVPTRGGSSKPGSIIPREGRVIPKETKAVLRASRMRDSRSNPGGSDGLRSKSFGLYLWQQHLKQPRKEHDKVLSENEKGKKKHAGVPGFQDANKPLPSTREIGLAARYYAQVPAHKDYGSASRAEHR